MNHDISEARKILGLLIGFNTISSLSNKMLINFIQEYLKDFGVDCDIAFNQDGTKADILATIGPMVEGGVILSGHTDVVPVEGQNWDTDPFKMVERNGRLFGRGACDMKGFIAVALALVPYFKSLNLKVPIYFAFSYDEELGCLGAPSLIARICEKIPTPLAAIIGEPTSMRLVNAHKGTVACETTVKGLPGHSSQVHLGVNAISYATACIRCLEQIGEELESDGTIDERFQPNYSTISVNTISGGTATNIIPEECKFTWDCRSILSNDGMLALSKLETYCEEILEPEMQKIAIEANIKTSIKSSVPPLVAGRDNPAENLVRYLTGQNQASVVAFTAEAGLFQEAGIPSVICGPGSIDQAHRPNEYIDLTQLEECSNFLIKLANWAMR
jgi:acetylornithine deacetylase